MSRKRPNRQKIARIILAGLLSLTLILTARFFGWRAQERQRLQNGSQLIETAQGPIEFTTYGQGPAVLVLHGTIGGYDQALMLAEAAATEAYQFIAISRPGYLRTPLDTGTTLAQQADAYAALLDELGIERAAVMAVSGGGPSALHFALRHPERTWGMVMLATSSDVEAGRDKTAPPPNLPPAWLLELLFTDVTSWVVTRAAQWQPARFLALLVGEQYTQAALDDPTQYHLYTRLVDSFALTSQRRAGSYNDNAQFLSQPRPPVTQITTPMLILQGTEDNASLIRQQQYLHTAAPHTEYVEVEEGTHYMSISHGDVLAPLIQAFLDAHRPVVQPDPR